MLYNVTFREVALVIFFKIKYWFYTSENKLLISRHINFIGYSFSGLSSLVMK